MRQSNAQLLNAIKVNVKNFLASTMAMWQQANEQT